MISQHDLLNALQEDFKGYEIMQTMLLNKVPKYGNDVSGSMSLEINGHVTLEKR